MNAKGLIRILYIEDDEDDFFVAQENLDDIATGFYELEWAPTYALGQEKMRERDFDLYLVDYRLGAESGLELIKNARDMGLVKPMILFTGLDDREIDVAAMQAGADDYLTKSEIGPYILERTIRYALNQYEITKKLHESEQKLRDYVDTASDWIWEIDDDLRFSSITGSEMKLNPGFSKEAIGRRCWELNSSDANNESWDSLKHSMEKRLPFYNFEFSLAHPESGLFISQLSGKPVLGGNGEFAGYRGTGRNRTSEREVEEKLRQAQKMDAIGQLTGGIAHDFNNLLHVVQANLELVGNQIDEETGFGEMVGAALNAVERGRHLTGQLLTFSRQQELLAEVSSVNELINDTLPLMKRAVREDLKINMDLDDALPNIKVDANMLTNALLNLTVNSRDAMPRGGVLTIKTLSMQLDDLAFSGKSETVSGPYVVISVEDNGEGISHENLNKVTEPFFTTKNVDEGTGLGLSMVYGFVAQSNGYMDIESEEGKGTIVNLYFPVSTERVDESIELEISNVIYPEEKHTVLLVEDDDLVRQTIVKILKSIGYDVIEAKGGDHALEILDNNMKSERSIRLVLSDIVMPGDINGIELGHRVEDKYPGVSVLLTSGYPDKDLTMNSGKNVRDEFKFLKKPYSTKDLERAFGELLLSS